MSWRTAYELLVDVNFEGVFSNEAKVFSIAVLG